ncbi:MAG TPA: ribosome maturation factor RimM [Microlunatus sp.]
METVEVVIGIVGRPHGVRGEVAVAPRTDEPERRFRVGAALRGEGTDRVLTVESSRAHSGRMLVRFVEAPDRSAVESLRGVRLVVDVPADERPTEPEEFYDRQLVGLRVLDAGGVAVGRVVVVLHLPGQDLLEIDTEQGSRLVPFVSALVPEIDLARGVLRLADVPGLLSEHESTEEEPP